jgi:hypothetical protein
MMLHVFLCSCLQSSCGAQLGMAQPGEAAPSTLLETRWADCIAVPA